MGGSERNFYELFFKRQHNDGASFEGELVDGDGSIILKIMRQ